MQLLTNAQRLELCIYSESHPNLPRIKLGRWAKKKFELEHPLANSAVSSILKRSRFLHAMDRNDLPLRRIYKIRRPKMDLALGLWATQYGRSRSCAPSFEDYRHQSRVYREVTKYKTRTSTTLEFTGFLRRYGLIGPVDSWNFRGSVKAILDKTGERVLSNKEILTLAGVIKGAASEGDSPDDDLATDYDNDSDGIVSDFDSDDNISKDLEVTDNRSENRTGEKMLQPVSAVPAASQLPQSPQPPKGPETPAPQTPAPFITARVLAAPQPEAPEPTASEPESPQPTAPQPEVSIRHETCWSERNVITILDDSDIEAPMDHDADDAKSVEHGKNDGAITRTTAAEGTSTKSASDYRSLVVVLDLLDQYMATQELVHMVLEDRREKKEQELKTNTTSSKIPPASQSSGVEGSLEETLSSITAVMDDLDEAKPMERATRLILRHMHYHLTCTASP
ncbi:unnamed protein product [Mortierella alpina]